MDAQRFRLFIKELFFLQGGRTVLVGAVEGGEAVGLKPGPCDVFVDGRRTAMIHIEPEMMPARANPLEFHQWRAVSTCDQTGLTREMVVAQECFLEGAMTVYGHRHLLGIESPPPDYVPDDMTLGPRLPEGWDGDAWMRVGGGGYFLRAWNKGEGKYAVGRATRYEEARQELLDRIAQGARRVVITVEEARQG